jgi:hypothetical protein
MAWRMNEARLVDFTVAAWVYFAPGDDVIQKVRRRQKGLRLLSKIDKPRGRSGLRGSTCLISMSLTKASIYKSEAGS